MQVAAAREDATSATIGAVGQAKEVRLTNSMALVMMLTTNLYSNQLLAAIREPLCNAWDANIEAGTTDQPIEITFTDDYCMRIRDKGLGIHPDKMDDIYGVYGDSTKANNNAVTGGFGLGSKAPWAIADSFQVISDHAGTRTIYNMPKACVERDGFPAILPVASMPTEESGLTVIIPIPEDQWEEAQNYATYIVKHGGMNARINDHGISPLELDTKPGSYNVNQVEWYDPYMGSGNIFIRYGAVVYPMLKTEQTKAVVESLERFMNIVEYTRIVIQAAPGTLALSPSRESLSSSKMTIDGLTDLLVSLVQTMESDIITQIPQSVKNACTRMRNNYEPRYFGSELRVIDYIRPYAVQRYLKSPLGAGFVAKYKPELLAAAKAGDCKAWSVGDKSFNAVVSLELSKSRASAKSGSRYDTEYMAKVYKRFVIKPLGKVFLNPSLKIKNLSFAHVSYWDNKIVSSNFNSNALHQTLMDHDHFINFFTRRFVFLTSRKINLAESIKCFPKYHPRGQNWIYKVQPNDPLKAEIQASFEAQGFEVVDLTLNHSWDEPAQKRLLELATRPPKPAKPKDVKPAVKNSLVPLSAVFSKSGKCKRTEYQALDVWDQLGNQDNPLFYCELSDCDTYSSDKQHRLGLFTYDVDLTPEELSKGVLVRNGVEVNMAIKRGAVHINEYFGPKFAKAIQSKAYRNYVTKFRKLDIREAYNISSRDIKLFKELGIKLPGLDKMVHNPYFERLLWLGQRLGHNTLKALLPEGYDVDEAVNPTLVKPKFVTIIRSVYSDKMLRAISRTEDDLLEILKLYPHRKGIIKALVLDAIKQGTKK